MQYCARHTLSRYAPIMEPDLGGGKPVFVKGGLLGANRELQPSFISPRYKTGLFESIH